MSQKAVPDQGGNRGMSFHLMSIGVIALIPFVIFEIVLWLWTLASVQHFFLALIGTIICVVFAAVILLSGLQGKAGPIYIFVSVLGLIAVFNGVWIGLRIKDSMTPYWQYTIGATYTNVAPTEPAAAYEDAGVIGFTSGTEVDGKKALGNQGASGPLYCAAPIFDESQQARAEYWAVGLDCCESQTGFFCDDAHGEKAKTGLVIPVEKSWGGGAQKTTYERFMDVVKQAASRSSVESPETPIMVRFVENAETLSSSSFSHGLLWLFLVSLFYLIVSLVAGVALHTASGRLFFRK